MKKSAFIVMMCLLNSILLFSQVAINTDGSAPDNSAILDVQSTSHGVLLPRMTFEQRNSITNPEEGLMIFCSDCMRTGKGTLSIFQDGKWRNIDLTCTTPAYQGENTHIPEVTQITWNWNPSPIATGYLFYDSDWVILIDVGNTTSYIETGLTCWTSYTRYVQPYNDCGPGSAGGMYESTLPIPFSPAPTEGIHDVSTLGVIVWNWDEVSGATGYKWSAINDFATATEMGTSTSKTETGLACNTPYTRFAWAYDNCGYSTATTLTETSSIDVPDPPTEGDHVSWHYQIVWNWSSVPGATGYKWSNTNNYATATDLGTATTKTETGLTCNTSYTSYVWAYNVCGEYSTSVTLTQATIECCGSSYTISHTAGNVAPVNKTVTYGIVADIPGEPLKCWISSNLGADNQATAVDDATEASAGWYWQFNRMQGYKHDGEIRTPNTTWIYPYENSDWLIANDPCNLELGSNWRIPTYSEWNNVNLSGGWESWNDPWNSALKIHAAGFLDYEEGSLYDRGANGNYWSSTMYDNDEYLGLFMYFHSSFCIVTYNGKSVGNSLRCLRD